MPRVFALNLHAAYRCAHSGACCTAGWAIPVEAEKRPALGSAVLVPGDDGACAFFDRSTRLCRVHRDRGERAKPDACRHFPRVALVDDRGTRVTLSHFCPTAARLLFEPEAALTIVDAAEAFPATDEYEGLDARGEWPPLVHRTLLFDRDAYERWEAFIVRALGSHATTRETLARIATVAERLRGWTPAAGEMPRFLERLEAAADTDAGALDRYRRIGESARQIVMDAIPDSLRSMAAACATASTWHQHPHLARGTEHRAPGTEPVAPSTAHCAPGVERIMARYLAAKAFASWTAYQGRGVRTLVAELVLADALVRDLAAERSLFEAIREADRLLVHLADRDTLIERLDAVEDSHPIT